MFTRKIGRRQAYGSGMRWGVSGLALFLFACGAGEPRPAPKAPAVAVAPPRIDAEPEEPPPPTGPVVVEVKAAAAPWVERAPPAGTRTPSRYDKLLAEGERASLVKTNAEEIFGFDDEHGVIGPLELPGQIAKAMFGRGDSLLVVTDSGKLFSASNLGAAKTASAFEERTSPAGALHWDAAGDYLVASDGKKVHVSRDDGKTWKVTSAAPWGTLRLVLVRFDGVMAVQGGPEKTPVTFVSRNEGKSWQRASFQAEQLSRSGAFIWSNVWGCRAVLSENGSTWSTGGAELARHQAARGWASSFGSASTPEGYVAGVHRSLSEPPPPKVPTLKERRTGRGCPKPKQLGKKARAAGILGLLDGASAGMLSSGLAGELSLGTLSGAFGDAADGGGIGGGPIGGLGFGSGSGRGSVCQGLVCLAPAGSSERPRTRFEFHRDGRCAAASQGRACVAGSVFDRLPKIVIRDEMTGKRRLVEVPAGCEPLRLKSVMGLGVLTCKSSGSAVSVRTAGKDGVFADEGELSESAATGWPVAGARDGTLLFQERCTEKQPCHGVVRRPAASGQKGAWRTLVVKDALAYRPLPRGGALAIVRGSRENSLDFVLASADGHETLLARNIAIEGRVAEVSVDDRGRLIVQERRAGKMESFVVGVDEKRYPL